MPRLTDTDRVQWYSGVESSLDLTAATAVINVDGTDYACTWTGTATQAGSLWSREARTDTWFSGPARTPNAGDVVLALGTHEAELKVTAEGATVTRKLPSIAVRA